jgi:hypothetical protein
LRSEASRGVKRALSIEETLEISRAKHKRKKDAANDGSLEGFERIEKKGNTFEILYNKPPKPITGEFLLFRDKSRRQEVHKIFRSFVTDDIIRLMMNRIPKSDLVYRWNPLQARFLSMPMIHNLMKPNIICHGDLQSKEIVS